MTKSLRHALIFVGLLTLLRLVALAFQSLDLGPDEAQYWAWAQTPAFGYFSKPPMIAWLIGLTTRIAGDGEFGVRFAAPLLHGATALLIFVFAKKLYGERTALWSAIVFATLPAVSLSSALISTDVPLLFYWAGALYVLIEALDRPTLTRAAILGAMIGLGLLTKYAMGYFLLCTGIAAFIVPGMRRLVLSSFGLVALLVALLVFAPNIVWNIQHSFATIAHTASNANLKSDLVHPSSLGDFLVSQLGVFGPILFIGLIVTALTLIQDLKRARSPDLLLACFSLPVILMAAIVAFLSRANANWAAPAYVAATPLIVDALITQNRRILFAASLNLHVIAAILMIAGVADPALADAVGMSNALKRVRGWGELGADLSLRASAAPYTAILADDRELMGELIYYLDPRSVPVVMWDWDRPPRNHYELANRIDTRTGARVLYVSLTPEPTFVLQRFTRTEPLGPVTVYPDPKHPRTVYLFDLEQFRPLP
jgi:4-amino-4-deoxy-L-arabinose transferase-like glycosyltransferase